VTLTGGARLGPYEILDPIGAGGMGEVYRARDTRLDRTVAIKVLPARVAAREDLRQRFEREARAVSALNHPHICTLFDVGNVDGVYFFVMEYIQGESLAKRLERGPLALQEALRLGVQVAQALDQAHHAGVVHRDLKPGNLMLTKSGVKLLDFGLAKVREANSAVRAAAVLTTLPTETRALTIEGTIMGTFQYMAPEQLEGAEADARSDIFAFGAVLYETITGRRAFQGKSQASLISAIMTADPAPISTAKPLTPPALERTIGRCLAKDPEDRWQTARDLANELSWIVGSGSQAGVTGVAAARRAGHERLAWSVAAALALLLVTALFFTVRHFTEVVPARPMVRFRIEKPEGSELGPEAIPALSHDGQRVAFSAIAGGRPRIFFRALNAFTAQALPGTEDGEFPFFSPDDRFLGFMTPSGWKRLDLSAGGVQTISGGRGVPGAWGPDGTILSSYANGWAVFAVPASGGTPRPVTEVDRKNNERGHTRPGFLPDGRHFLYSVTDASLTRYSVFAGSLDDPRLKKHLVDASGVAAYAPPGYLLYVRDDILMAQPFDVRRLELIGSPTPVAEQAGGGVSDRTGAGARFSASADGTLVWKPGPSVRMAQLTWLDRSGKVLETLGEPGETTNPVLSPDGQRVLATIRDPATRTRDIWVYDLIRGTIRRITFDPAEDYNPVWSPDGRYIAFTSTRKGQRDIYRKLSDGTGAEEELLVSELAKNVESWSADGKYIVYNQAVPGTSSSDLYLLPVDGDRKPVPFATSKASEQQGSISPNGRWIAYGSNESGGRMQVYVQAAPGTGGQGKWQVSPGLGAGPQWRSDGKELFYLSRDGLFAVPVKTGGPSFEAGTPVKLFEIRRGPSQRNHFTVSADGQRFLVSMAPDEKDFDHFNVILNFTAGLKR